MKNYVFVTVLITAMVVSTVTAQDTLRIQSLRSVDLCSGNKRWLLAVSLGTIRFADSLESFDITIGYEKSIIRPTDVLKEGTLSAQMSNGPTMNTVVPGEMRIFGFNVARSVSGNVPLVAVSGDFLGQCGEVGVVSIPYPPDFNGEFKKRYTVNLVDEIRPILNRRIVADFGCSFDIDRDTIQAAQQLKTYGIAISRTGKSDDLQGTMDIRIESDSVTMGFDDVRCGNCLIDSIVNKINSEMSVYYRTSDSSRPGDPIVFHTTIRRRNTSFVKAGRLIATVRNGDTCSCSVPGRNDTLDIFFEKPVVGVQSSQDDGSCTIETRNGLIIGKCLHHGMKKLELFDLYGNVVLVTSKPETELMELSMNDLSRGLYIATMMCDGYWKRKTIVK